MQPSTSPVKSLILCFNIFALPPRFIGRDLFGGRGRGRPPASLKRIPRHQSAGDGAHSTL